MQAVGLRVFLAALPLVGLFLFPLTSFANDDWHPDHFYEKLTGTQTTQQDLYGGEFSRVHDYYYYQQRRIDPRDRLYGGRNYYGHDYGNGYYRRGWGQPRSWYGRGDGREGWHCPPRYGYGRDDYYRRDNYYRRYRSPW